MFADLCWGDLKPFVQHPCAAHRKLFFLFDSVHLLKCIRNNWLGQSDVDNTFAFPDIEDGSICKASLSHLRQLYASEKDNYIKMAPSLSYKVLNPSNLERQNVKLALRLFDEKINHCPRHIWHGHWHRHLWYIKISEHYFAHLENSECEVD